MENWKYLVFLEPNNESLLKKKKQLFQMLPMGKEKTQNFLLDSVIRQVLIIYVGELKSKL